MLTKTLLFTALSALAAAAPSRKRDTYYGVSLEVNVHPLIDGNPEYEPAPVEINVLTSLYNVSASEIKIDPNIASNIDINTVECRAYKDDAGVIPGSAPFNVTNPAELSTNLVTVASVLCYITGASG